MIRLATATPLLALLLAVPAPAQRADEVPLGDLLEVVVTSRELLAIDARGGGQKALALELGEEVLWTGSAGRVAVAITDRRLLAVATVSASWQESRHRAGETIPREAQLGDRVALVTTEVRVIGFDGRTGNLIESAIGPSERVIATGVGDNVAVAITTRRALGLSPLVGGFFARSIRVAERVESVNAAANLATVVTSQRILIFRAPSGSWEERRLGLN